MSYPYTNQGIDKVDTKAGFRTGRVLFVEDPTKFTPREFLSFINEGFIPVTVTESSAGNISYSFATWKAVDGTYTLGGKNSTDLDVAFA